MRSLRYPSDKKDPSSAALGCSRTRSRIYSPAWSALEYASLERWTSGPRSKKHILWAVDLVGTNIAACLSDMLARRRTRRPAPCPPHFFGVYTKVSAATGILTTTAPPSSVALTITPARKAYFLYVGVCSSGGNTTVLGSSSVTPTFCNFSLVNFAACTTSRFISKQEMTMTPHICCCFALLGVEVAPELLQDRLRRHAEDGWVQGVTLVDHRVGGCAPPFTRII